MELLNIQFAILIIKLAICVLPVVIGVALISTKEEGKRGMRNWLCVRLFGVGNAIEYSKFARFILVVGLLMILLGLAATWFLFLAELLEESAR